MNYLILLCSLIVFEASGTILHEWVYNEATTSPVPDSINPSNANYKMTLLAGAKLTSEGLECNGGYGETAGNIPTYGTISHTLEARLKLTGIALGVSPLALDSNYNPTTGAYSHRQFDAIVNNENANDKKWIAGSDYFRRTKKPMSGNGVVSETLNEWIHMMISYNVETNLVTIYRNGEQYGDSYRPAGGFMNINEQVRALACVRASKPTFNTASLIGTIAYAAIHKGAKTPADVTNLCNDADTRCNDNNECTIDSCDEPTGDCINEDKICDDQDDCTTNSCDINTGECKYEEIPCSNNVYCDGEEYCDGGQCMDAVDIDCPDNFVCDEDAKDCMRDCNLFAIDGYLRDCSSEFAGNENDISELQGNGQDLQDQIDGIGESIEGLETGIDALSTALTTVQDQIGESLEENPDTIYNMLASQFEDINNVETALGEAKEQLSGEITDINSDIEGIKSNIISMEEDIESMKTNAEAIGVVVQTLQITLTNVDTLVKAFAPHKDDEKKEENDNGQSGQSVVGVPFISWNDKNILIIGLLIVNMMLLTVLLVYCCMSKRKYTYQPIHYNSETDQEVTPLNK